MNHVSLLRVLLVDDEPLARARLRTVLAEVASPAIEVVAEAGDAEEAAARLVHHAVDLVLLDIQMPGLDGMAWARQLAARPQPVAVVFVTAHADHAVQAFEVEALDYLTKPVRLERLQASLQKAERKIAQMRRAQAEAGQVLLVYDRGRTERVPVVDVLYLKAELKYVTVRTAVREHVLDQSLLDLEQRYGGHFLRIHRNTLVARHAMRALEKHCDADEGEGWALRLDGLSERLPVSRRQLAAVREALVH